MNSTFRITDEKLEALASAFEGGIYGGAFKEIFEGRFFFSAGMHSVDSKRQMNFDKVYTPKASYEAMSLKWGIEGAMVLPTTYELKPFAGIRGSLINTDEIVESGSGAADLTFDASNCWLMR